MTDLYKKKIVSSKKMSKLRKEFQEKKLKIAHCHGVFDLLHPGHIAHLQEARSIADVLVVTITAAAFVNKGPGRPYFNDDLRLQSVAALSCVDYVLLANTETALDMIDLVQPEYYVKGKEYAVAEDDVTGKIVDEVERVRLYGGDVYYTDGIVFSSTRLLNNHFEAIPSVVKDYAKEMLKIYKFEDIRHVIESMENLKVAVIGDIIIDDYVFCKVQGLMSKDRAFSALYDYEERYFGGVLAIARHLASFSRHVTVCSLLGTEPDLKEYIVKNLNGEIQLELQVEPQFRTAIKKRYLERRGIRDEYEKLFSINMLADELKHSQFSRNEFYSKLEKVANENDIVLMADYGHGVIDQTAMKILQEKAKFLAVNCQTNSSNYGANLITKYSRADAFSLDEREIRLAFAANKSEDVGELLLKLQRHLQSSYGWGTLGSSGSIGCNNNGEIDRCPALTLTVQDTIGAGDAFFALVSLCAQLKAPVCIASFIGNLGGAMAANIVGNSNGIHKVNLLKFATTLLKY